MNKRDLSESDICAKYITPAIVESGWHELTQIRREVSFTKGRIIVRGKMARRGEPKRADYILYYRPNLPIAVIEAKDNKHPVGAGMQQALDYAETLGIPFVFASNGDAFVFHDATGNTAVREQEVALHEFPSPAELWRRYQSWKGLGPETDAVVLQDYYEDGSGKEPRYYQRAAINAAVEAIAKGQDRILLVMATGTGKTYTAFQIIWRLWKAKQKKRILFLADRNVLVNQTMVNDFRPFGGAMAKLSTESKTIERADGAEMTLTTAIDKRRRRIDTSYEIYLALYQAITGPEDYQKRFRELSPDFFDLIVIDECHRGSVADDSAWREILEYFGSATQIGLTATPRETRYLSNIHYFGEPVYTYSLRQGIADGFLAPYKVVKVHLSSDVEGYRPRRGERDRYGHEIADRIYNEKDFDRNLVIDERTRQVAKKITAYLQESGDPMQKTIVFCVDTEHAERMRQALINENPGLVQQFPRYVMRITGDDAEGVKQVDNFIDPESKTPVIVTTSRLLSTGVDVQTCRLIVLDREVGSMTEFKQIVGRGTRVHEDTNKLFFTLMDFRRATNHFADPDFDGDPVQIYEPADGEPLLPPETAEAATVDGSDAALYVQKPDIDIRTVNDGPRKYYVQGRTVTVLKERVEILDEQGKLITETLRDYTRKTVRRQFATLHSFLGEWGRVERRRAVLDELERNGLALDALAEEVGRDLDPFDLICHVAYDQPPLTRRERAARVRRDVFSRYGERARAVLEALLDKYQEEGVTDFSDLNMLKIKPFNTLGTLTELLGQFGGRDGFARAAAELAAALYAEAA